MSLSEPSFAFSFSLLHLNLPPTFFTSLSVLQASSMSSVLWTSKVPSTFSRAGSSILEDQVCQKPAQGGVKGTTIDLLSEVTAHRDGALNLLKLGEAVNVNELLVVVESKAPTSLLEQGEADVAQTVIVP